MKTDTTLSDCIFCHAASREPGDFDVLLLWKTEYSIMMLNRYPYTNGHIMIAPRRHIDNMNELVEDERMDLFNLIIASQNILAQIYRPLGFNVGFNLGRCAGAGIEDHIHSHIVPRWDGDHNFMRVLDDTRLIPEDLKSTFEKCRKELAREH